MNKNKILNGLLEEISVVSAFLVFLIGASILMG